MLLNWVVLFRELEGRNRRIRNDAFADPLDRPEWRGLLWIVPILTRLAAGWHVETRVPRRGDSRIAKTLSFRSSAAARGAGIPD
ncbi:hypothetical protein B5K08_07060 [Rhizobium leguminosarum bv. trifolii]|uniref:Uncharacterized protein n=1 Tax=Rhizobium leguminosarum bv. trifolii TaxID=386 RepID=A0A3E1BUM6_RHILT|nr:hypothetical protein [Rhizobium leguminosarum]RFB97159.1 hypothetical protein B5K08_07060 [Rhizobium leguminosarum bv. trifolii]RFB98529.1 hypothetical protein B5K10_07050 [Rhizobium leguminosarum bv. trifolii]